METVSFARNEYNDKAIELYWQENEKMKERLPHADIQHVGSSAIPGTLTKGDVDIQVRVQKEEFEEAVCVLNALYQLNEGSVQTSSFRSFYTNDTILPLGVQLTVCHSEFDVFHKFRDVLLINEGYREQYDQLKASFDGKDMESYRKAKQHFFEQLKKTPEYKNLG
ncbi:GrpB family protein [Paenibacillus sp. Marseille-Q4541]|uniref:GrpB family protein n=1 Tax=Paenibacillus sp. Marseille-Q4541 TaxID=2831522 RepID=UPI001BA474F9|nr:GrpB family protein [Paenibacillus sp. Marseille-Q4541]